MDLQAQETNRGFAITPRVVFGLFLLVLGTLFLLDRMGTINFDDYGRFWPVFVIAFGLAKLFQPEGRGFGLVLLVFGSWALLDAFDIVHFDWEYVWPAALILIGLSLVWRGVRVGLGRGLDSGKDPGTRMSAFAMLGGVDRKYTTQEFRGGDATAVMGGCELDFRQASPAKCPRTGRWWCRGSRSSGASPTPASPCRRTPPSGWSLKVSPSWAGSR
jgi:hypothetical protein